jgi:hypothetical protein
MTASRVAEIEAAIGGDILTQLEKQKRGELPPRLPGPTVRNPLVAPAIILALGLVVVTGIIAVTFGRYVVKTAMIGPQTHIVIVDRITGTIRVCDLFRSECEVGRTVERK